MSIIVRIIEWLAKVLKWDMASTDHDVHVELIPPETPPQTPPEAPKLPPEPRLLWDTPKDAWHSVRVICDEMGLTYQEKNLICACIFQESEFNNNAVGRNRNAHGQILSSDWGICQINDRWNIGEGKPFPSVQYVKDHPEKCVRWMITCYKQGQLKLWASYSSGAYRRWLSTGSPMWNLKA